MLTSNLFYVILCVLKEVRQMKDTFSIRINDERILVKLDEDAKKQDRSRNYILNSIIKKHYELTGDC